MSDRFWSKVDMSGGPDACWNWIAFCDDDGYGRFQLSKRVSRTAHRVAWQMANGPICDDLCVLHKCDNPSCVNVSHLFLGSRLDNNQDRQRKGRNGLVRMFGDANPARIHPDKVRRGEAHGNSTITEEIVRRVRAGAGTNRAVAAELGLSEAHVSKIRSRKLWAHVA